VVEEGLAAVVPLGRRKHVGENLLEQLPVRRLVKRLQQGDNNLSQLGRMCRSTPMRCMYGSVCQLQ
jgi:hypothetical protein